LGLLVLLLVLVVLLVGLCQGLAGLREDERRGKRVGGELVLLVLLHCQQQGLRRALRLHDA
jgi:hypothetical protein